MAAEVKDRRSQYRCTKDVGIHCTSLNGNENQLVLIRNYSSRGIYFESNRKIPPGNTIVLRTLGAADFLDNETVFNVPSFSISNSDAEVCTLFRSHVLAKVQRSVRLEGNTISPRYGMGSEIQILSDF